MANNKCWLKEWCPCKTAGCVTRPDDGCPVYRYFKNLIEEDFDERIKAFDEQKFWPDLPYHIADKVRHSLEISKLNDCNNCKKRMNCPHVPKVGEWVRINCFEWEAEDGKQGTD